MIIKNLTTRFDLAVTNLAFIKNKLYFLIAEFLTSFEHGRHRKCNVVK